jgi:hypothetical protein
VAGSNSFVKGCLGVPEHEEGHIFAQSKLVVENLCQTDSGKVAVALRLTRRAAKPYRV